MFAIAGGIILAFCVIMVAGALIGEILDHFHFRR